jgi:cupin fold WbuC family metalloprotein
MLLSINQSDISQLIEKSYQNKRKRAIKVIHPPQKEGYRMIINCIQPDSYIQPHIHKLNNGSENWIYLKGKIGLILFDTTGKIEDIKIISHNSHLMIDIPPNTYHTAISLEKDSIMYEVSNGPYDQNTYKEFAPWAPNEESENQADYLQQLKKKMEEFYDTKKNS